MAEVKRYDIVGGCYAQPFHTMEEVEDGEYVEHSDYARLERERDSAQAELTRLRAVEKAAKSMIEAVPADIDAIVRAYDALAEALGVTSAVDRECDRGRKG